jgi:hypothetical protein
MLDGGSNNGTLVGDPFAATDIVETLELAWVCVCESGLIWEGAWFASVNNVAVQENTSLTVAVSTRVPVVMNKADIDFAPHKTAYMAGIDPDIENEVEQAWDETILQIPAKINVSEPLVVLLSTLGVEIGAPSRTYLAGMSSGSNSVNNENMFNGTYNITSATNGTVETAPPVLKASHRSIGAYVDGVVLPRLRNRADYSTLNQAVKDVKHVVDTTETASQNQWPSTFGDNSAAVILGPCFPAVYANDGWVVQSGGDAALSQLVNPRHPIPSLASDTIVETAPVGPFIGDASRTDLGLCSTPWDTSETFGHGINAFWRQTISDIDARAEALIRARKSSYM